MYSSKHGNLIPAVVFLLTAERRLFEQQGTANSPTHKFCASVLAPALSCFCWVVPLTPAASACCATLTHATCLLSPLPCPAQGCSNPVGCVLSPRLSGGAGDRGERGGERGRLERPPFCSRSPDNHTILMIMTLNFFGVQGPRSCLASHQRPAAAPNNTP